MERGASNLGRIYGGGCEAAPEGLGDWATICIVDRAARSPFLAHLPQIPLAEQGLQKLARAWGDRAAGFSKEKCAYGRKLLGD